MGLMRSALLSASQNVWLRERAPRMRFVRRTVARFMPGETFDDAVTACGKLQAEGIGTVFTQLGENVDNPAQARAVAQHYASALERIHREHLPAEISVKLTHLGLDLGAKICAENLRHILQAAGDVAVWLDMESSSYVDATLDIYREARALSPSAGVCLQAYLRRTGRDLEALLPMGAAIRLVKGAYSEPAEIAFPHKRDVDENYFQLARALLGAEARAAGVRAAIATHDTRLIRRILDLVKTDGVPRGALEFQMLYGIQRGEQRRLAREGWRSTVLIAYGSHWYPWFMRRLAERPANVGFAVKNLFLN